MVWGANSKAEIMVPYSFDERSVSGDWMQKDVTVESFSQARQLRF